MSCCQLEGYDDVFNEKRASKDLKRYRKKGPDKTTRLLLDALKADGVAGQTLLDIGGGIGVAHHELLAAGARSAVHIDAAEASLRIASEEVERRGHFGRVQFLRGDFVALAADIQPADVVIVDRVICCYADMAQLVTTSVDRTRRLYGAVFPRETRFVKVVAAWTNLLFRIRGNAFRFYVHAPHEIDRVIRRAGLSPRSVRDTLMWRVAVYERRAGS
jgi:2-polyprenyl-3-methyl-5-hydroxy-6-metoxy-1,4-benzoquinol methylase